VRVVPNDIPVIETERLRLRGHTLEDFPGGAAMWAEPIVYQFISGSASTEQQSWMRLLSYRGHWALMGFGYWAIEERATGRFIGELGFADFKRDLDPSIRGIPEIGWALAPDAHGKGYASESIRAALQWSDSDLAHNRTVCIIQPENLPSLRLAEKFGFCLLRQLSYRGTDICLVARERARP